MSTTSNVIGENAMPITLLGKKNGINRQRQNKSYDKILCLSRLNVNRNIQDDRDM